MKKIVGLGNALTDVLTVLKSDDLLAELSLPKGSMQLVGREVSESISANIEEGNRYLVTGGSASNTITGLARLGVPVGFVGKVGSDEIGDFFISDTEKNGIKPMLIRSQIPSGICVSLVSPDGERTMATYLGAACEMRAEDLKAEMFSGYDYCHIEGYLVQSHELIEQAMRLAKQAGAKISLDLASYNVVEENLDFLQRIAKEYVDVIFANEEEAKAFTGVEAAEAVHKIAEICEIAVVKLGAKGALVKKDGVCVEVASLPGVKCVDTTGAGDLFASGFLYGLVTGRTMEECGKIGSAVGGNVVQVVGPKMDNERWNAIRRKIDEI